MPPLDTPPSDPRARKADLRRQALARRAAMSPDARVAASHAAASHAMERLGFIAGRVVSLFAPFRDEIDTAPLAAALHTAGARLALPVVTAPDAPLLFRAYRPGDPLEPVGAYAIPTPLPEAPVVVPDILIVPLAAFDLDGYRIGYGAGHYDRTLAALRNGGRVTAFGFAFACQRFASVPHEDHDERVDGMITQDGFFSCGVSPAPLSCDGSTCDFSS